MASSMFYEGHHQLFSINEVGRQILMSLKAGREVIKGWGIEGVVFKKRGIFGNWLKTTLKLCENYTNSQKYIL